MIHYFSSTLPANMTRGPLICQLSFHAGDIAQVQINEEVTILAGLVRPHNYRGHSAATGEVMQWAKESRDLAETAAYDGLSLII
jgi:hypothetical protein